MHQFQRMTHEQAFFPYECMKRNTNRIDSHDLISNRTAPRRCQFWKLLGSADVYACVSWIKHGCSLSVHHFIRRLMELGVEPPSRPCWSRDIRRHLWQTADIDYSWDALGVSTEEAEMCKEHGFSKKRAGCSSPRPAWSQTVDGYSWGFPALRVPHSPCLVSHYICLKMATKQGFRVWWEMSKGSFIKMCNPCTWFLSKWWKKCIIEFSHIFIYKLLSWIPYLPIASVCYPSISLTLLNDT